MADSATLYNIAQQNPLNGGKAVYDARAILNINFDDGISSNNRLAAGNEEVQTTETNSKFLLYPNPNNGNMVLNYELSNNGKLELTDITGKIICEYNLNADASTININCEGLSNGLYLYKVIANDEILKAGKIAIIK